MMTYQRKLAVLKIASSQLRPRDKEQESVTPEKLIEYAKVLDEWVRTMGANGNG